MSKPQTEGMEPMEQRIRRFVVENFYVPEGESLPSDASLLERGIIDSTGVLELVAFLEREFELKVEERELLPDNLESISRICAYVGRKTRDPDSSSRAAGR
jgi:acyl carrier protein